MCYCSATYSPKQPFLTSKHTAMIDKSIDFVIDYLMCLPIALTENSKHKAIRALGYLSMFPYFILTVVFTGILLAALTIVKDLKEI